MTVHRVACGWILLCALRSASASDHQRCMVDRLAALGSDSAARIAYASGYTLGDAQHAQGIAADPLVYLKAFRAGASGQPSAFSVQDLALHQSIGHRTADPQRSEPLAWDAMPVRIDLGQPQPIDTQAQGVGYALGYVTGIPYQRLGLSVDWQGFALGFLDGRYGRPSLLPAAALDAAWESLEAELISAKARQSQDAAIAGDRFRRAYATRSDTIALPEGVLYRLIQGGDGDIPDDDDVVRIRYRATRVDGGDVESTPRDHPVDLPMPGLFAGLRLALSRIRSGSEVEIDVPGSLARGSAWSNELPGDSTLVYHLHLDGVVRYPLP